MTTDPPFGPDTALVVVDVQNDFAHPDGTLHVEGAEDVLGPITDLVHRARAAGALVAYTQDWHPPETPHFTTGGGSWPVHCVRGTWGARLHDDLPVVGPVVRKGTGGEDGYSGFTARDLSTGSDQPTGLEALLRDHGVDSVVVVGLAQDVCVKDTALDAQRLGFSTTVPLAATRPVEVEEGDGHRAVRDLTSAGVVVRDV